MAEAVESYFVATYVRFSSFRAVISGSPAAQQAIDDYAYALYAHKGLRRVWRTQLNYWVARDSAYGVERSEVFSGAVESTLRQLDERAAPIPDEVRYVFW